MKPALGLTVDRRCLSLVIWDAESPLRPCLRLARIPQNLESECLRKPTRRIDRE